MARKTLPSADYLRECFIYNPGTGVLVWRVRPSHHFGTEGEARRWNGRYGSKVVGSKTRSGPRKKYRSLTTSITTRDGKRHYFIHRLIWKMQTGEEPPIELDHRDRTATNNRWLNLRPATRMQQNRNVSIRYDSKSGAKGVYWSNACQKWQVSIQIDGNRVYLGVYETIKEASEAYQSAAKLRFGKFYPE